MPHLTANGTAMTALCPILPTVKSALAVELWNRVSPKWLLPQNLPNPLLRKNLRRKQAGGARYALWKTMPPRPVVRAARQPNRATTSLNRKMKSSKVKRGHARSVSLPILTARLSVPVVRLLSREARAVIQLRIDQRSLQISIQSSVMAVRKIMICSTRKVVFAWVKFCA